MASHRPSPPAPFPQWPVLRIPKKASKVFLAIGLADDVIDAEKTIQWLNDHDKLDWNLNNTYKAIYGHRTSVERFIDIWAYFEKNIEAANELQERYAL